MWQDVQRPSARPAAAAGFAMCLQSKASETQAAATSQGDGEAMLPTSALAKLPRGQEMAERTPFLRESTANTLSQFEILIKNNKNIHQKLGLTTVRYSCRLKEKRERHELIKPHDKSQETVHPPEERIWEVLREALALHAGIPGKPDTSVSQELRSHFLSELHPSQ